MSYDVYLTKTLQKSVKLLKKKFPNVKKDLFHIIKNLEEDPGIGNPIPGWNKEIWKVRCASTDIKRGKSGAFRTIYLWKSRHSKVYLLFTYFKGDKTDISKNEIEDILKKLTQELS
ncbi:hypothetical protein AKJ60_01090 [candidate division MSBL1 archaeon SCGC-AAA385M11]|nr:hypothetical protein AKJ60_01090 [candidate division MSBL1 archaeon SCGC-AAA385M11]